MGLRGSRSLFTLLASWVGWWVILAAWKIGPAIPAIRRVSREGAKGNASVNFGDGGFSATITEGTTVIWEGHTSFIALVLLVAVPPLILWALWLRRSNRPVAPDQLGEGTPPPDAMPDAEEARDRLRRR